MVITVRLLHYLIETPRPIFLYLLLYVLHRTMKFQSVQLFFWSLYLLVVEQFGWRNAQDDSGQTDTLVLVHVLFRHGNRTVNGPEELYPYDPYVNETYFPFGLGQLTNAGKMKEYSIGKALRRRYNTFLGPYYYPQIVDSLSTDYNRTKMSLELVLAGLFPPHRDEIWNQELLWQPIPYNYFPASQDKILLGVTCPHYLELYDKQIESEKVQTELATYKETFQYISRHTGLNVTKYLDVYNLFFGLATEEEWGFQLPEWTRGYWPEAIVNLTIQEYFVSTATTELNQMASGYFLQKVISDTNSKINGTNPGRKIYLYSAHENNIAELLILLGIFEPLHIPDYGSYVIFEIHNINNEYVVKIFYENYTADEPQLLKLPACEIFCEMSKFISLMEEYMPSEDLCYK
jgi:prostatic aicd phosphatase